RKCRKGFVLHNWTSCLKTTFTNMAQQPIQYATNLEHAIHYAGRTRNKGQYHHKSLHEKP
ncbi:MAG: hypothetical protein IIW85_06480, partial [Bacteroidaceae bacterium]|nr:hypothetical protein [Bacteroidaceae bacterium]